MPSFSKSSQAKLATCHPDLQRLFNEVIKHVDCTIICGHRGEKEQNEAFENGFSMLKFPNSKHNGSPSLAVDCLPYPIKWSDSESHHKFAGFVLGVASQMGIKIEWGGNWSSFEDRPHFQLK